jgi:hypothetical protein
MGSATSAVAVHPMEKRAAAASMANATPAVRPTDRATSLKTIDDDSMILTIRPAARASRGRRAG